MENLYKIDRYFLDDISFEFRGRKFALPVVMGSEYEDAVDIRKLRSETGLITFDNGFANTGACKSAITYVDGENGMLRYRGYPIEKIAEKKSYLETSYLLVEGNFPTEQQLSLLKMGVRRWAHPPENLFKILSGFPSNAHPMPMIAALVGALSTYYVMPSQEKLSRKVRQLNYIRLISAIRTITAKVYCTKMGTTLHSVAENRSYAGGFLSMIWGPDVLPEFEKALEIDLMLHADHEQNCSTSAVRTVGSSQVNIYSATSAGINALWGDLHGGACQRVIEMLLAIRKGGGSARSFLDKVKAKPGSFRLMGFGHRVYKYFDPRGTVLKNMCDKLWQSLDHRDPLIDIARELEVLALNDDYFIERNLYPNIDFYSGLLYRTLNLPLFMYTPLFVLGRMSGWIAQYEEMLSDPDLRLTRPRQIYIGEIERSIS